MNHLQYSFIISTRPLGIALQGYETVNCGGFFIGGFAETFLDSLPADVCLASFETGEPLSFAGVRHNCFLIEQSELVLTGSDMNTRAIYYIATGGEFAAFNDLFLARSILQALGCEVRYDAARTDTGPTFFDYVECVQPGETVRVSQVRGDISVRRDRFSNLLAQYESSYRELEESKSEVRAALSEAVARAVAGREEVNVALSGGIDSGAVTALAVAAGANVTAYSLATQWGDEFLEAQQTADFLGIALERVTISTDALVREIPTVIRFFHFCNVENVEIALVAHCLYKTLFERAAQPRCFITGYGSDLLNGGGVYTYENPAQFDQDIRRGLARVQKSNEFSGLAARQFNVQVVHPYWDSQVIRRSLRVPAQHKLRQGLDKHYLREAMVGRLPQATVLRTKLGAHLGTGVAQHLGALFGGAPRYREALQEVHRRIFCDDRPDWNRLP